MTFSKKLRAQRETHNHSQVSMAKAIGVARQTYLDLETGKTEPRLSTIEKISEIFNLKPSYWFGREDEKALGGMTDEMLMIELHRRLLGQRKLPELTNYAYANLGGTQVARNRTEINNLQ